MASAFESALDHNENVLITDPADFWQSKAALDAAIVLHTSVNGASTQV
jgi:hypothetical protein